MASFTPAKKKFTLGKKERLKSRATIQTLFSLNKSIKIYPLSLVWMEIPNQSKSSIEFGVSVSKRNFKTAVMRNKIKRKMREAYRLNKYLLLDQIAESNTKIPMMLIYVGKELISYQEMEVKLKQILLRLAKQVNR